LQSNFSLLVITHDEKFVEMLQRHCKTEGRYRYVSFDILYLVFICVL
jgi:hypothetical protein